MMPVVTATTLPIMAGGFKIILKDAKIYANKVIIQAVKTEKSREAVSQLPEKKKAEDFGLNLSPDLLKFYQQSFQKIEIEDFQMDVKGELEDPGFSQANAGQFVPKLKVPTLQAKPVELLRTSFVRPIDTYPGKIASVKLGATRGEVDHAEVPNRSAVKRLQLSTILKDQPLTRR